ncbi:MAG: hypothetical protein AB1523_01475 [Bacillota bacterium]
MKIKKYIVREMQEAMQLIREDLGPEAVIISSYPLPRRGLRDFFNPRQLEVTAAVDDSESPVFRRFSFAQKRIAPSSGGFLPVREEKYGQRFNNILRQREFGMNYLENWRRRLQAMDVEEKIISLLFADLQKEVPESDVLDPDEYVGLLIKKRIVALVEPVYKREQNPPLCFFVGPTGVGKTFTLAKLATRLAALEHKRVALISVGAGRLQAVEELKVLTRPAALSVEAVTTPAELAIAVRNQVDKDTIFVDTEGIPSQNAAQMLRLKSFLDVLEQPRDVFLVLSCPTRNRDLYKVITDFGRLDFSRIILTKLDETETYGSLLNAVCYAGRPVAYLATGLAIPDDLRPLDPRKLAEILLKGAQEVNERAFEINL